MGTREHLLAEVEQFLTKSGMGATYFGQKVGVGGNFVDRLRAGQDVMTTTADRVFTFIRSQQEPASRRRRRAPSKAA